jgi:hypothetical protein
VLREARLGLGQSGPDHLSAASGSSVIAKLPQPQPPKHALAGPERELVADELALRRWASFSVLAPRWY